MLTSTITRTISGLSKRPITRDDGDDDVPGGSSSSASFVNNMMVVDYDTPVWPPRPPDYTYHDFSQEGETLEEIERAAHEDDQDESSYYSSSTGSSNNSRLRKAICLRDLPFPVKLHDLLTHVHVEGLTDVISWQHHGRSFTIHDPNRFGEEIMALWFKQSKYHSFQRQLNLYGFRRLSTGMDKGCYFHELFLRDKRFLAKRMKRTKIKGMGRQPYAPDHEPNFYTLPYLPAVGTAAAAKVNDDASATFDELSDLETNVTGTGSLGQLLPEYQRRFIRATTTSSWLTERQHAQSCATATTASMSTSTSMSGCWGGMAYDLPSSIAVCSNVLDREVQSMHAEQLYHTIRPVQGSSESSEASSSRSTSPSATVVSTAGHTSHEADLITGALCAIASYFDYSAPRNFAAYSL